MFFNLYTPYLKLCRNLSKSPPKPNKYVPNLSPNLVQKYLQTSPQTSLKHPWISNMSSFFPGGCRNCRRDIDFTLYAQWFPAFWAFFRCPVWGGVKRNTPLWRTACLCLMYTPGSVSNLCSGLFMDIWRGILGGVRGGVGRFLVETWWQIRGNTSHLYEM